MAAKTNSQEWTESLPDKCPPQEAVAPDEEMVFYRFVEADLPAEADFLPIIPRFPITTPEDACRVKAVSIWNDLQAMLSARKIRKGQSRKIVTLKLSRESGLVQGTYRPNHFSWWRRKGFDPVIHCNAVPE